MQDEQDRMDADRASGIRNEQEPTNDIAARPAPSPEPLNKDAAYWLAREIADLATSAADAVYLIKVVTAALAQAPRVAWSNEDDGGDLELRAIGLVVMTAAICAAEAGADRAETLDAIGRGYDQVAELAAACRLARAAGALVPL